MKSKFINIFKTIFETLSKCIVPVLPVLIGAGMIKVVLLLLSPTVFNLLSDSSSTYIVLSLVADAGFYFLPIFIAVSSAEVFNTNKYIAALVGSVLISPSLIELVETGYELSVFNLPIVSASYANQIIPSILTIWIMSYIYGFLDKHINKNFSSVLVPLFTLVIMIPIELCLIGPIGIWVGDNLVKFIIWVKDFGFIGSAIICAIIPFITILGLSGANLSAMLLLMTSGCDPVLFFSNVMYNSTLGFVLLALYIKNKDGECLGSAITSTVGGISEPAVFGYLVKDVKSIIALTISLFVCGGLSGVLGIKAYSFGSFGIFGSITTISNESTIVPALICIGVGCILGFVLNFILHSTKK